ncbi:MAG: NADH-quinone oxidoreductase subunit J [Alphaproteobacteria bacterium]|jgi:NADH-quinone oxidoreductase subunit J|tara:strand:+ start:89 stop:673 length:585 start_codon:yes stop_codon:yes gene_type:complete
MNIIVFYIISSITVLSSLSVVFSSNPVHSVLFLIFTFFNVAVLFLLSNAEFLAMTIVIVYVGAVAVLFLFVVMMLNINEVLIKEGFLKYFPFGFILITIFLLELFFVFKDITLKNTSSSKMNISELLDKGNNNTESIGMFLYTDFFIVFQISGFLLLVAMIGAIVLAKNENLNIKSQKIIYQKSLDKKKVIKLK